MQGLWSRAAQARPCGCTPCLQAGTNIARRSTTAAGRRQLRASDVFTACYTAMFATAALADYRIKDRRRKQWDLAIEEVRLGGKPQAPSVPTQTRLAYDHAIDSKGLQSEQSSLSGADPSDLNGYEQLLEDVYPGRRVWKGTTWDWVPLPGMSRRQVEAYMQTLDPRCLKSRQICQQDLVVVENMLDIDDSWMTDRYIATPIEPKTWQDMATMEDMVGKLVTKLLGASRTWGSMKSQDKSTSSVSTQSISQNAENLPNLRPSYHSLEQRSVLNTGIRRILRSVKATDEHKEHVVAKICYKMLVSKSPPDTFTYNILIAELTRLRLHNLAQIVIESFERDSSLRPTEQTIVAIINHYTQTKQSAALLSFTKLMNGHKDQNGRRLRTQRHHVNELVHQNVRDWAQIHRIRLDGGFLYQKIVRTPEICEALIQGAIKLLGLKSVIWFLRGSLNDGCAISPGLLVQVVDLCMQEINRRITEARYTYRDTFRHGYKLLEHLCWQFNDNYDPQDRIVFTREVRQRVSQLLHICGFDSSFLEKGQRGWSLAFYQQMTRMIAYLELEDARDALAHLQDRVHRLDDAIQLRLARYADVEPLQAGIEVLTPHLPPSRTSAVVRALPKSQPRLPDVSMEHNRHMVPRVYSLPFHHYGQAGGSKSLVAIG